MQEEQLHSKGQERDAFLSGTYHPGLTSKLMWEKLQRIWKIKNLRESILFVIGMLVIFRAVAHIPVPGVDIAALQSFLAGNQILGLLNVFSGGTVENFSVAMLGVAPYITASIIFQLLVMVVAAARPQRISLPRPSSHDGKEERRSQLP